jgi:hypothetical protein
VNHFFGKMYFSTSKNFKMGCISYWDILFFCFWKQISAWLSRFILQCTYINFALEKLPKETECKLLMTTNGLSISIALWIAHMAFTMDFNPLKQYIVDFFAYSTTPPLGVLVPTLLIPLYYSNLIHIGEMSTWNKKRQCQHIGTSFGPTDYIGSVIFCARRRCSYSQSV